MYKSSIAFSDEGLRNHPERGTRLDHQSHCFPDDSLLGLVREVLHDPTVPQLQGFLHGFSAGDHSVVWNVYAFGLGVLRGLPGPPDDLPDFNVSLFGDPDEALFCHQRCSTAETHQKFAGQECQHRNTPDVSYI